MSSADMQMQMNVQMDMQMDMQMDSEESGSTGLANQHHVHERTPLLFSTTSSSEGYAPATTHTQSGATTTTTPATPATIIAAPTTPTETVLGTILAPRVETPSVSSDHVTPRKCNSTKRHSLSQGYVGSNVNHNYNNNHNNINSNSNPFLQKKVDEIEALLSQPEIDLWQLRELALSPGGLVNDTIRKRAWPRLVGLDHNNDPLPLNHIVLDPKSSGGANENDAATASAYASAATTQPPQTPAHPPTTVTTIEIDAQHELLQPTEEEKKSWVVVDSEQFPPSSTLLVESMDANQIDRDVARCTWHLLTGNQRSRRSQHRCITRNSTRGNEYQKASSSLTPTTTTTTTSPSPSQRAPNRLPPSGSKTKSGRQKTTSASSPHRAKYRRNRKISVLLKKKQNRLANLINLTLVYSYDRSDGDGNGNGKHNATGAPSPHRLRYYQGYHDVACIFLHALGGASTNVPKSPKKGGGGDDASSEPQTQQQQHYSSGDLELPSKVLCQVSFSHFQDALRSDFLRLQTGLKLMLFPLLWKIDPEVHRHLLDADMEPFFCLSWVLTWFAHDVRDTALVKRLFDAFLVAHPALPVYASLAMMAHPYNRRIILETDCDFAALHQCLASLPKHSCRVGWKEQKVEGAFGNIVTYVSDDDERHGGEETEHDNEHDNDNEHDGCDHAGEHSGGRPGFIISASSSVAGGDQYTVNTNTDTYLEEEQSEFDDDHDNDSHTFDTRSNYTSETLYTESSFPTSIQSGGLVSIHHHNHNYNNTIGGGGVGAVSSLNHKAMGGAGGASLASGSLVSLQEDYQHCPTDRTLISTEEPDFMSKESTLVSGTWNDGGPCGDGVGGDVENPPLVGTSNSSANANDETHTSERAALLLGDPNPVPFECVLDTALQFMTKYPPSSLVNLAKKYYQDDWESQISLLATTVSDPVGGGGNNGNNDPDVQQLIGLLQPTPPAWSILPTCTSDWLEKQKLRQDLGLKPTSRNDRRRRRAKKKKTGSIGIGTRTVSYDSLSNALDERDAASASAAVSEQKPPKASKPANGTTDPMEYVRSNPENRAVAAIGCAPGLEAKNRERQKLRKQRTRRKRQRALVIGCGVVLIGGLLYGAANYRTLQQQQQQREPPSGEGDTTEMAKDTTAAASLPAVPSTEDLESLGRGLSSSSEGRKGGGGGSEDAADPLTAAANVILPRLDNLNQKGKKTKQVGTSTKKNNPSPSLEQSETQVPAKPSKPEISSSSSSKAPSTRLGSSISSASAKTTVSVAPSSPTTALRSQSTTTTAAASEDSSSAVVPVDRSKPPLPLTSAHGNSIVLKLLSHTKAFAFGLFRKTWNVCRGFILRFHFLQRGERKRSRLGR